MSGHRYVAVFDVGKTNAKLALVDLVQMREIAVRQIPNTVLRGQPYPHYDTDALWIFFISGLREYARIASVEAISVTTHGASMALLDLDGELAAPVLDYEHDGPDNLSTEYDAARPDFTESGSPRLPMGLNAGGQLFWQFNAFPEIRKQTKTILTYPQYWTYRLTGRAANEVTSLGCHTDLWCPREARFSSLVERQGWLPFMAPVCKATDLLGTISADTAEKTGLSVDTPVFCGIHDSNASLYPHLIAREAPFSVVSTGTWVISMAIGSGEEVQLDPARDTLINVNAFGDPVPSGRFMGGREYELIMAGVPADHDDEDIENILQKQIMLLPSVETRSGPFQERHHRWTTDEAQLSGGQRYVVTSFYLALMTSASLSIIGAKGQAYIEGPFAENALYCKMLAAATGRIVNAVKGTGTSIGAALLTRNCPSSYWENKPQVYETIEKFAHYARRWNSGVLAER
jgi:sugar (pentulose or hexulose) kinase